MKVFVPLSDELLESLDLSLEDLVPFDLDYEILRPNAPFEMSAGTTPQVSEPA